MLLFAPLIHGAVYLSVGVFVDLWTQLDTWVRQQVATSKEGLTGWLKKHAVIWRQVGRVCFHLAENKQEPVLPFAFMATYAPSHSRAGRVQYRPLGKALQEYAGQGNKKALINLLSETEAATLAGLSAKPNEALADTDIVLTTMNSPILRLTCLLG